MVNPGYYIMREGEKSRENIAEHYKMNDGVSVQLTPLVDIGFLSKGADGIIGANTDDQHHQTDE